MIDTEMTEAQAMTASTINNLVMGHFLFAHPQYLPRVAAVEVDGRRELILPVEAMAAFGGWAVANGFIDESDAAAVLKQLPTEVGGDR